MTAAVSRKELHTMIDVMPDRFIEAMMPLVACMAEEYWKPALEPADSEEAAMIKGRINDYEQDPASFVPLDKMP